VKDDDIREKEAEQLFLKLDRDARAGGYNLNPDIEFTRDLVKGLIINERRYGYQACPCRLASGIKEEDLDIICPCDYRDPDLNEYDACYCALYVSEKVLKGEKKTGSIPERRPPLEERRKEKPKGVIGNITSPPLPVWRCKVCGYLCARENPPEICPICKAKKERFERFM